MVLVSENDTKISIGNALMELVETLPFHKISVNRLAAAAHVSRNTFYYYFNSIYDLVEWLFDFHIHQQIVKNDKENHELRPLDILQALYQHKAYYSVMFNSAAALTLQNKINKRCDDIYRACFCQLLDGRNMSQKDQATLICFFAKATAYTTIIYAQMGMPYGYRHNDNDFSELNIKLMKHAIELYAQPASVQTIHSNLLQCISAGPAKYT